MPKKMTKRKREKQKQERLKFWIDFLLSFFVVIVPIIALIVYGFGVDIPKIALGIYVSVVFIIAGILFIIFPALEKFGFEKAGVGFNKLTGWKQLTKNEAKANTEVFGGVLIVIGLFFAVLTFIYC